jgi:hypothetical protein
MIQLHPLRTLREAIGDVSTAINAAREYRKAAAVRCDTQTHNPMTASIPL